LFHHVLVVNDAAHGAFMSTESGLLTAAMETQQPDGQWRAVAKLRFPTGTRQSVVLRAGEVWQFIVPASATGLPVKARVALGGSSGTIYSQPFVANVDPSLAGLPLNCWLARIRPTEPDQAVAIAVADTKRSN
jgi:hypothetical protein